MDFLNQDCDEGLTEQLIDFNINDSSNQGMVITDDATEEGCHICKFINTILSL